MRAKHRHVNVAESLADALARIAPSKPCPIAPHGERDIRGVAGRARDPLLASRSPEIAIDLRRVDLAAAFARFDPRDEPAIARPGHGDVARVPFRRRQLHFLAATTVAIEAGDDER